jgi:O-antigen/teichoic acid export membrane protein
VGGVALAPQLLSLLFGAPYEAGAWPIRFLLVSIGFIAISMVTRAVLLVREHTSVETRIVAVAAAVNIGVNLAFIRSYGIVGAAVLTALCEMFVLVGEWLYMPRIKVRLSLRPVLRPLAASVVMAFVLIVLIRRLGVVADVLVGGAVYVGVLVVLGGVPREITRHRRWPLSG